MTCHEEVLDAARIISIQKDVNEFTPEEVVSFLKKKGTDYKKNTIRTHITSRCCKNAPNNHAVVRSGANGCGKSLYWMYLTAR